MAAGYDPRLVCVYCRRMMQPRHTSGESTEYGCRACGYAHTLKASMLGEAFAFSPDDIWAAFDNDLKPLPLIFPGDESE